MKTFTISEANQNFSKVCRAVDAGDAVTIEKMGKEKYVLLSADEYRKLVGEIVWIEIDEKTFAKFEAMKDEVTLHEVEHIEGSKYRYTRSKMPNNSLDVEVDGTELIVNFNQSLLDAISTREAATLYRTIDVDVSKESIAALVEDKTKEDELCNTLFVAQLIEDKEKEERSGVEEIRTAKSNLL